MFFVKAASAVFVIAYVFGPVKISLVKICR